jgi:dTDP-4-amino-4,6-dideoxy-D-galactose acyltransferase
MDTVTWLDFDTKLFGFPVAKINPAHLTSEDLETILAQLRHQGAHLVYWPSDSQDVISQQAAQAFGGFLADRKITYYQTLNDFQHIATDVVAYTENVPNSELLDLAIESGLYSRFRIDPKIPIEIFTQLYQQWITNSTKHEIAKEVLVIHRQHSIVAMATLGEKQGRGDIGLLAVAQNYRGIGLGQQLLQAAKDWFFTHGYPDCQVITQQANLPACRLYERGGFHIESIENFYHFWLV